MSLPVIENILARLETNVNAITTGNGYNQTLTAIRPKRLNIEDQLNKDLVVLIVQQPTPNVIRQAISKKVLAQLVDLTAVVIDSDEAVTSIETRINKVRSDIEKKIRSDPTANGLAEDITIESIEYLTGTKATGVKVVLKVVYSTLYDNPYTQA